MLAVVEAVNSAVWAWNVSDFAVHVEMINYMKGCRVTHRLQLDVTRITMLHAVLSIILSAMPCSNLKWFGKKIVSQLQNEVSIVLKKSLASGNTAYSVEKNACLWTLVILTVIRGW